MSIKSTRLRYVSSRSADLLEAFINALPFKVEIKSISFGGKRWFCWFVLPDNIEHSLIDKAAKLKDIDVSSIELEEF